MDYYQTFLLRFARARIEKNINNYGKYINEIFAKENIIYPKQVLKYVLVWWNKFLAKENSFGKQF